jgi:hypothetical protein
VDDEPAAPEGPLGPERDDSELGPGSVGERFDRRYWWVAASGLVLLAVVVTAVLGSASPTARATLEAPGPVARPSGVSTSGPGRPTSAVGASPTSTPSTTRPPPTTLPAPTPSSTEPPTPTAPTTTAPAVPPNGVGIQVTGTGQASLTVVDGANESQVNDVALPWSTVLVDSPPSVNVSVQSSDGSETSTISCEIDGPGITPVSDSSSGPFATVSCGTTLGQ